MSYVSFPINQIGQQVRVRPIGYLSAVLKVGSVINGRIHFERKDYEMLKDMYDPEWRKQKVRVTLGNTEECKTCAEPVT
jgi:hypothetical protein